MAPGGSPGGCPRRGHRPLACVLALALLVPCPGPAGAGRALLQGPAPAPNHHHPHHRPLQHRRKASRTDVILEECADKHFIYWNCSKSPLLDHIHRLPLPTVQRDFRGAVEEAWQRVGDAETQAKEAGGMMMRLGLWESATMPREERLRESWVLDREKRQKYLDMRMNIHKNNMVVTPTLREAPRVKGIPLYCEGVEPKPGEERSKRVAVLYRGQSFRTGHGERGVKQQAEVLEMQERTLLRPLRDRGYQVDVFLAVYRDEAFEAGVHLETLIAQLSPKGIVVLPGAPQTITYVFESEIAVMSMLLYTMEAMETMYDLVHLTRYDLVYKAPILDYPDLDLDKFNFPFKEKANAWRSKNVRTVHEDWNKEETPRVGDACFTFHGAFTAGFLAEIVDEFLRVLPYGQDTWHGHPWPRDRIEIYHHFAAYPSRLAAPVTRAASRPTTMWWGIANFIGEGNLAFLADSLHDSNESKEDQNSNPLYFFQRDWFDPDFDTEICRTLDDFKRASPNLTP